MVDADLIVTSRRALLEYYGGSDLHASAMYQAAELESIRGATRLVAAQTDASDLVVYAPVSASDQHAEVARERCLQYLVDRTFSDMAWAYRQQHGRNDPTWFEPLREHTHIARLP